ncbi:hypothetical protein Cadr_000003309 [Camelus dromedarius]|uniref:Uncharacterized protein n=1 Tax=Camelus dromedarius TaxID=9838 RepID=A0A5N4C0X0_CAMDR|nr:hypothetical protein Cadr_000003309 [Camelus dromedarius]
MLRTNVPPDPKRWQPLRLEESEKRNDKAESQVRTRSHVGVDVESPEQPVEERKLREDNQNGARRRLW